MALERGKLSNVQRVAAAATVGIITCASSKKVYIKSILCHYPGGGGINTAAAHVYVVPNGDAFSDADTGTSVNRVFDVDVQSGETVLLEPSYPIVLDTTGDAIFVGTGNISGV